MGGFYGSTALRGATHDDVRDLLVEWQRGRGHELVEDPLPPLDPGAERGAWLFSHGDWTVVQWSHVEETERLLWELSRLDRPLLHVASHDDDVWGWILFRDREVIAEFNSNPRLMAGPDGGSWFGGVPPNDLAAGDPDRLARELGLPELAEELRAIQSRKALFSSVPCFAFCRALGVDALFGAFDYTDEGEAVDCPGWRRERLCFRDRSAGDESAFDLHAASAWPPSEEPERRRGDDEERAFELPPLLRLMMGAVQVASFLARPFLAFAAWRHRMQAKLAGESDGPSGGPELEPSPLPWSVDGDLIRNERHRLSLSPPEGVTASSRFWNPAQALVLEGAAGRIFVHRVLTRHVRSLNQGWTTLSDECWTTAGGHPARTQELERQMPVQNDEGKIEDELVTRTVHAIMGPRALYAVTLDLRAEATPESLEQLRAVVDGLRFED